MLGFLIEYECFRVHVVSNADKDHKWSRLAKIYRWNELPSGMMRISPWPHIDQDPFSCYLDDIYFNAYWEIRQSYLDKSFTELGEIEKRLESRGKYDKDLRDTLNIIIDRLDHIPDSEVGI